MTRDDRLGGMMMWQADWKETLYNSLVHQACQHRCLLAREALS
jgi:hypothetical protein